MTASCEVVLFAPGADPHKENFEPLYFRDEECCREDKDEVDEGYIPGTTPLNMAASSEVSCMTFFFPQRGKKGNWVSFLETY